MRAALWFLALFGIAVAVAVFAGNNDATVTLYWSPYRIDLSLNFVILALVFSFALIYAAIRTVALLFSLPEQAKRWRALQKERAINAELFNAQSHFLAGRYLRSQKAALHALNLDKSREQAHLHKASSTADLVGNEAQLRALAHVMAAQSAHALQDTAARDEHLTQALEHQHKYQHLRATQDTREGTQLLAANWALDERDAAAAQRWLGQLPSGAARRTLALRLKLKAAQLANSTADALETTRLLAKHHAFSKDVASSLIKSLVLKRLEDARDVGQMQSTWRSLDAKDRANPDVAIHAAYRLSVMSGRDLDTALVTDWLLPVWSVLTTSEHAGIGNGLARLERTRFIELIDTLEAVLAMQTESQDMAWLARIEQAQQANPRDPRLQYLAGMACKAHQLWGKAQQQLLQASAQLNDHTLKRRTWCALAELAEQRGDAATAGSAWKKAAQI